MILRHRRDAIEQLRTRPDSRILEIGCGTGLNFSHLTPLLDPKQGALIGADFSEPMLRRAQTRVDRHQWTNVHLVLTDASNMHFTQQFDAVLFSYSLTMVGDWRRAIQNAYDHLNPGGRVVVLDFGDFARWGLLRPLMRLWLRANHVDISRPYLGGLQQLFADLHVSRWLGGYGFVAAGTR